MAMHAVLCRTNATPFLTRVGIVGVIAAVSATANCQPIKLTPLDGAEGDFFARAVAVNGPITIVGAWQDDDNGTNSGSAYIFDTSSGAQLFKLLAQGGTAEDAFGISVATNGAYAIVGASSDNTTGTRSGAAYLFDTKTGSQVAKFIPSDGTNNDFFGLSVSIDGDIAVVGAPRARAAYVFRISTGEQVSILVPENPFAPEFGFSVAVSGDTAVVGAFREITNSQPSGAAFTFNVHSGEQLLRLVANDGEADDNFGISVAIEKDTVVIGASRGNHNFGETGAAYIYNAITGEQIRKLVAVGGRSGDAFGRAVAITNNTIVVGANTRDEAQFDSGCMYLFNASTGMQRIKLLPSDGDQEDQFGLSVAIDENTVVGGALYDDDNGADSGSAYIFAMPNTLCLADTNHDGTITSTDFTAWINAFNNSLLECDQNGDSSCRPADFTAWIANFNAGCP